MPMTIPVAAPRHDHAGREGAPDQDQKEHQRTQARGGSSSGSSNRRNLPLCHDLPPLHLSTSETEPEEPHSLAGRCSGQTDQAGSSATGVAASTSALMDRGAAGSAI